MKFIHFINAETSEHVLGRGIELSPNHRKINETSSGIFCYPLIKIPFKTPVEEDNEYYIDFKKEEYLLNNSLSIEEAWEVVGALRVTRRNQKVKNVSGVIFEIDNMHWPITVFIDIGHQIGNKFAQILENSPNIDIIYNDHKNNLQETINNIESKRYVMASAPFTVNTEIALLDLIDKLKLAGGGIWKEDSFECMLTKNVSEKRIAKIIELENRYYKTLVQ